MTVNRFLPAEQRYSIRLVGWCLGGGLAGYAGAKRGVPFMTFNGMKLGTGLLEDIGPEGMINAEKIGRQYILETDFLADPKKSKGKKAWLIRCFPDGKFPGKTFMLPQEYPKPYDVHSGTSYVLKRIWQDQTMSHNPSIEKIRYDRSQRTKTQKTMYEDIFQDDQYEDILKDDQYEDI